MVDVQPQVEPTAPAQTLSGTARYLNRELSWLDFNARVLALAERADVPILERAKFLAIYSENLDEFFQTRVGGLKEQQAAGLGTTSPDGMSTLEQLRAIRARVETLIERASRVFAEELAPGLAEVGITFSNWSNLDDDDRAYLDREFDERIYPVLTPLAVDPAHPFPYISNLSLNLAVMIRDPGTRIRRIARVKVPPLLPRFVVLPDGERFVPLEQVIAARITTLFAGMEVVSHSPFRVTRNADFELEEEESEDLLAAVETIIRRRRRSPRVVRLEVDTTMSDEVLTLLLRELELQPPDVYEIDGPLDLGGLWRVHSLPRPELKYAWTPTTQLRLAASGGEAAPDMFRVIAAGDVLVHHPYDSFSTSVEAFVEQASRDPDVLAIKQTLYRTSGPESPVLRSLTVAAETGKQVVALVELTARGDEAQNIQWARQLEQSGVHVVYGMVGLKTHAKICLVVRREESGIRRYFHIGTGNYNAKTARLYEDFGLLSCDDTLGADLTELFNYLTGYSRQRQYRKLLVAPITLRSSLLELIEREGRRPDGRIVIKCNGLVDPVIIDALCDASERGCEIDLLVRAMCCLRPGVPGLSSRIRVRSIVGRWLEHSRIFRFGSDERGPEYWIGSADLRERNLDRRVEAVVPIEDDQLKACLQTVLDVCFDDDELAWILKPDGSWQRVPVIRGINAHERLQELAVARLAEAR